MKLERSEIIVKEGMEAGFLSVMQDQGLNLLRGVDGCLSGRIGQGIENPSKFLLLLEWDSLEAHKAFNQAPAYGTFMSLIGPFVVTGAMEHFEMVAD